MESSSIFHQVPLLVLYIITVVVVLLSVEVGYRIGYRRRLYGTNEQDAPVGGMVGATLGLLAFLLAFTFGAAATRYDTRKQMVLQEANAIGTVYLRTDFLPDPQRAEARDALVKYAQLRAQGVRTLLQPETMAESSALQDQLWSIAAAVGNESPTPVTSLFIQSLNDMIDLDESRITAGRNRIPDSIWLALYLVTIITTAAVGYQFGLAGTRSWIATILMVLAFTLVILLIADLDRPQRGLIQVSQQPLFDLLQKIAP
jgi:uncharacterized membrane protein YtjA (UPF0391 family)